MNDEILEAAKNYIKVHENVYRGEYSGSPDDVVPFLCNKIAKAYIALEAELARHAWHRIDPDDQGTWPEEREIVEIYHRIGGVEVEMWASIKYRMLRSKIDPTHYRRIVGPEDGG